jgi:hypothetical protein
MATVTAQLAMLVLAAVALAALLTAVDRRADGAPPGMARDLERLRLLTALEGAGLMVRG